MGAKVITDAAVCGVVAQAIPSHLGKLAVTPEMSLRTDLAIDSMGLISMVFLLEQNLGVELYDVWTQFTEAESVAEIIDLVKASAHKGA